MKRQTLLALLAAWVAGSLLLLAPWSAHAQMPSTVTDQDIARTKAQIQQQMGSVTDEKIDAVRKRVIVPQQQGTNDQAIRAFRPQMPRLDAMPQVQAKANVDIGALSGQFLSQLKPTNPRDILAMPKLYVFVTMAMPPESIKSLIAQAERAGATLVLRGMVNNSVSQTGAAVRKLMGQHQVGFAIDPESFDRFGVTQAPSFVLVKAAAMQARACTEKQCEPAEGFAKVAGDVSLDHALEYIERRAPRFRGEAQGFLKRMRG
ncbi:MAG: type-F conjugative transfer system pilin assembly protein TrbC [Rhizobacter sp.]